MADPEIRNSEGRVAGWSVTVGEGEFSSTFRAANKFVALVKLKEVA